MSTSIRTVVARARRDGRWWYIELPELGTSGQARTVKEISDTAREIAALWLDVDESTIEISLSLEVPQRAAALWDEANAADERARRDARAAATLRRSAIAALKSEGVTQADAARVLRVSPQRISQLSHS